MDGLGPPSGTWTLGPSSPLAAWSPSLSTDSPKQRTVVEAASPAAAPGFTWLRQALEWFGAEEADVQGGFPLVADVCSALLRDTQAAAMDDASEARLTLGHVESMLGGLMASAALLQPAALSHVLQVGCVGCVGIEYSGHVTACRACQPPT